MWRHLAIHAILVLAIAGVVFLAARLYDNREFIKDNTATSMRPLPTTIRLSS